MSTLGRSETLGQLAAAFAKARMKFLPVGKDKEASVFSKRTGNTFTYAYADLADCLDAVTTALSEAKIALFQPVRVENEKAVATTLLVHESGEWLSEEFAVTIADPSDARSVGSATTYACRYGLRLLGLSISDGSDDDAESARGGQHEMAPQGSRACPSCGVVGSIMKDSKTGGWACWKSKGGCEAKFPEGPFPTSAPVEQELMPRRKEPSASEQATTGASGVASAARGEATTGAESSSKRKGKAFVGINPDRMMTTETPVIPEVGNAPMSADDAMTGGGTEAKAHTTKWTTGTFRATDGESHGAPILGPGQIAFVVGPTGYVTNGLTEAQFMESVKVVPAVDRATKKGASKDMLRAMFGYETRLELTEAQGEAFIKALYAKLPEQGA